MVRNVTKKTFFSKLFKLNFKSENLSLKQLIQKELLVAIALYQQQHPEVNNWKQITASLSEKIILCDSKNLTWALKYRCAISFPLANLVNLSPLSVAYQLVTLLPSPSKNTINNTSLEVAVAVLNSGWIDFFLCDRVILAPNQNCNLAIWLEHLAISIVKQSNQKYLLPKKSKKIDNLFPLQYIYGRCNSLLSLGETTGLISLETENLAHTYWQIKKPFPVDWSDFQSNLCLIQPQEWDLLRQLFIILDYLAENKKYSREHWLQFTKNFSQVWLKFTAHCRFCGEISQQAPQLAIARLFVIAVTHWCLKNILISQLNIIPQKNI